MSRWGSLKVDKDWIRAVKDRDGWMCRVDGATPKAHGLHAHHIWTRSRRPTRHDIDNGISLCYAHHRWAHREPLEFHEWIRTELGDDLYDVLRSRSLRTKATA